MCKRRYLALILLLLSACTPPAQQIVIMPTLAALPTSTPAPTDTASPTEVPTQTETPLPTAVPPSATPNLLETQVAQLQATNAAAQKTLDALLTRSAPTSTLNATPDDYPDATPTPSQTITQTLTPSHVPSPPPAVVAMLPQMVYVRSTANLRTCASRDCESLTQLQPGEMAMATGTIQGEVITSGNNLWYRVDYVGREAYVYSQLVSLTPPTAVPVFVPPTSPPVSVAPPVIPPSGSGGCPDISASCSALTCDQAYACLAAGHQGLDRDHDGIPCESICS